MKLKKAVIIQGKIQKIKVTKVEILKILLIFLIKSNEYKNISDDMRNEIDPNKQERSRDNDEIESDEEVNIHDSVESVDIQNENENRTQDRKNCKKRSSNGLILAEIIQQKKNI